MSIHGRFRELYAIIEKYRVIIGNYERSEVFKKTN